MRTWWIFTQLPLAFTAWCQFICYAITIYTRKWRYWSANVIADSSATIAKLLNQLYESANDTHRQNIEGKIVPESENIIAPTMDKILDTGSSNNNAAESDTKRAQELIERNLPNEIWDKIMSYMDIFDLKNLRRVSTRWLDIADVVIKRESKWYQKCIDDIPKKYWSSILEHHANPKLSCNAYHESKIHSHIWISMYESWLGWNSLIDKSIRLKTIDISSPEYEASIDALSVSGKLVALNVSHDDTCDKHVAVYDIGNVNECRFYIGDRINIVSPASEIDSVHVCQKDKEILVVSVDNRSSVRYWHVAPSSNTKPTILRDVADDEYSDFYVSTSLGYCYTLRRKFINSNGVRPLDESLFITLSIDRLSTAMDSRENQITLVDRNPMGYYYDIVGDGDKVMILSGYRGSNILKIEEYTVDRGELRTLLTISKPDINAEFEIFNPCVVAFLNGRHIGFSVAGRPFKVYNTFRDLKLMSEVLSYVYHIGLLILGLGTGEICIINVKDVDGLENLNLETMRHKIVKLVPCDEFPNVHHLAVTEHNSIQYIVAGTYETIHLIEFH